MITIEHDIPIPQHTMSPMTSAFVETLSMLQPTHCFQFTDQQQPEITVALAIVALKKPHWTFVTYPYPSVGQSKMWRVWRIS
jgi:hypothetical protein